MKAGRTCHRGTDVDKVAPSLAKVATIVVVNYQPALGVCARNSFQICSIPAAKSFGSTAGTKSSMKDTRHILTMSGAYPDQNGVNTDKVLVKPLLFTSVTV